MTGFAQHVAQLNIGRVRHTLDDPRMADFMNNLARVNALAERSPGFVWRYTDASGNATDTRPFADDPRMMVNMSVWESVEALETFGRPCTRASTPASTNGSRSSMAPISSCGTSRPGTGRACRRRSSGSSI
jgi:Domain of unknown function (DUF3291)